MVEMLKQNIRKIRHFTTLVSIVLTVIALGALGFKGLNLGLDFTGGMVTEVKVDKSLTNHDLLDALQPKVTIKKKQQIVFVFFIAFRFG